MTMHDYERIVADYSELPEAARKAFDPHVAGAQILEITTGRAHGVVETGISYFRDGRVHEIIYDETTAKILGGTEPGVIEAVIAALPASGRQEVLEGGGKIRKIKIKHDDRDDREYVHVHYVDAAGNITGRKLELDGSAKRAAAA